MCYNLSFLKTIFYRMSLKRIKEFRPPLQERETRNFSRLQSITMLAFIYQSHQYRSQSLFFPLTSGQKTRDSGSNHFSHAHRCRRFETGWAEFGYFLCYFKMVVPRVSRFLTTGQGKRRLGQNSAISFVISKWLFRESLVF